MSSISFEQFVVFGTDIVGLERLLRGLQAVAQILVAFPSLISLLLPLLALFSSQPSRTPSSSSSQLQFALTATLPALKTRLALARRFLRVFRFLDSFHSAQVIYTNVLDKPLEAWLDILGRTLMGMYGLLESATLLDVLDVPGLEIWGPERTVALNIEAQRFWLLALVCGVLSGGVKILRVFAYAPVPIDGKGYGTGEAQGEEDGEKLDWEKERERLRRVVEARKEARALWRREVRVRVKALGRRLIADALDCVLPGVVVGWVSVESGTVGVTMLVTTVLTGLEVWERCGMQVRSRRGI